MLRQIKLTEANSEKVDELSRQTGKTADDVVNEAVSRMTNERDSDEKTKFERWRAALLRIEGMWENRDDLPDFEQLRKSWDRNLWSR